MSMDGENTDQRQGHQVRQGNARWLRLLCNPKTVHTLISLGQLLVSVVRLFSGQ